MNILFCGQAESGKDESANHLFKFADSTKWKRKAFASEVKRIFCENFNVNMEFVEKWKRVKVAPPGFDMPVRDCLILIGDGWRKINKDVWVNRCLDNEKLNLIISDGRYISESTRVRKNGISILLWNPSKENNIDSPSENELLPFVRELENVPSGKINFDHIPFDFWIKNDTTLNHLRDKIETLIVPYLKD